tara:strand:+ start:244 stop:768 length:525 start_codon:yes stop_codon:yes gene_type:complete
MSCKVVPVKECNICFDIYKNNEIADLKCWADDHIICKNCFSKESKRRKEMGLNSPAECLICKPFQEKIEKITINPSRNITITIDNIHYRQQETYCQFWIRMLFSAIFLAVIYTGLILNWHLFKTLTYFMETGQLFDEKIDWHIYNAFYALVIDTIILFSCAFLREWFYNECNRY